MPGSFAVHTRMSTSPTQHINHTDRHDVDLAIWQHTLLTATERVLQDFMCILTLDTRGGASEIRVSQDIAVSVLVFGGPCVSRCNTID